MNPSIVDGKKHRSIPAFSAVLLMTALAVVGLFSLNRLTIQYLPSIPEKGLTVSFSYKNATAESVEAEVTSVLEGALGGIKGCRSVTSTSRKGSGSVRLTFQKRVDLAAIRFEVASRIRNIWPRLPEGVTYPSINVGTDGSKSQQALSFTLKSELPSESILLYAQEKLINALSQVEGVVDLQLKGATPFVWDVVLDSDALDALGLRASSVISAFQTYYGQCSLGLAREGESLLSVRLREDVGNDFGDIPVGVSDGRTIHLRDVATWRYVESEPDGYYRENGLNTITLAISVASDANLLKTLRDVRRTMEELRSSFPAELTVSVGYDASEYVQEELNKIYIRTGLCLLILMLFVLISSRSFRFSGLIAVSLMVNLLCCVFIYALIGLPVHIYTLAGITVSLGILIDNALVMTDHYSRWKDRKVFPSMVFATLTTVTSLLLVFLLPESETKNLSDFVWVIVINLAVSLFSAYIFIPALSDLLPFSAKPRKRSWQRTVSALKCNYRYGLLVNWGRKKKWLFLLVLMASFYPAWRLFDRSLGKGDFYRTPERPELVIRAGLPEGCSVMQLNEVIKEMENYIAGFDEVESFSTRIAAYNDAQISIRFRKDLERTSFPSVFKGEVIRMAASFGGANWSVSGIDEQNFDNNIITDFRDSRITLTGYNYPLLLQYARSLIDRLSDHPRISDAEIWGAGWYGRPKTEFVLDYDRERMAALGANPYNWFEALSNMLYDGHLRVALPGTDATAIVRFRTSASENYDLWHISHAPVRVDSSAFSLADFGSISKQRSSLEIRRKNQSYEVNVCYNFIGSWQLGKKIAEETVGWMNSEVLPVGFKAETPEANWAEKNKGKYIWLILLIVAVIYAMLSAAFESFRDAWAVILLIPLSFIGLFLAFGWGGLQFDQGGFAAFVMLAGITVNAGIYFVSAFQSRGTSLRCWLQAFSDKAAPVFLTILSTILGLIPFLSDGPQEAFWFDFAVGTMAGLVFSVPGLLILLPAFLLPRRFRRRQTGDIQK